MGGNLVEFVEKYLEFRSKYYLAIAEANEIDEIRYKSLMEGMITAYETINFEHWNTFEYLMARYEDYMREEE